MRAFTLLYAMEDHKITYAGPRPIKILNGTLKK
jgi:hypothetical protein